MGVASISNIVGGHPKKFVGLRRGWRGIAVVWGGRRGGIGRAGCLWRWRRTVVVAVIVGGRRAVSLWAGGGLRFGGR